MAFPSTGGSKNRLKGAWANALSAASVAKDRATALHDKAAAGDITSGDIMDFIAILRDIKGALTTVAAVPGIAQYAKDQLNDPAFDIAAEYTALIATIDNVRSWVVTNFPKSGNYLLERSFDGNAELVDRTFSTAQTATFRATLTTLINQID